MGARVFSTFFSGAGFFSLILVLKARQIGFKNAFRSERWILIFSFVAIFIGFFYFYLFLNLRDGQLEVVLNEPSTFEGVVITDPVRSENYQLFEVDLADPWRGKAKILGARLPEFDYGDKLEIKGMFTESQLENDWPITFYPEIKLLEKGGGSWIKGSLLDFKNFLVRKFDLFFSGDQAALIKGLIFGERGNFSPEFKEDMARSGVTHLVALSGYNIAILALAIEKAFSFFLSRRKRFYLSLILILIFVLMVGGEASVVRAAIMGALALLAQHVGRPHDVLYLVVLSAVGMILVNPRITATSLGFQLSFLSLLGIILIEPALRRIFNLKEEKKRESFLAWRENALTTTSAQLAVLPILLINFDYFSVTSILANVLILFTVPLVMFLGFLLVGLATFSAFLGFFIAKVVSVLLFYEIVVIKLFSTLNLPFGNFAAPTWVYVLVYGAICGIIMYSYKYEKTR